MTTFLLTLVTLLAGVLDVCVLARILMSWIPMDRNNRLVSLVFDITEPILAPIRRLMPDMGFLDLSPMVALIIIQMAERILRTILTRFV